MVAQVVLTYLGLAVCIKMEQYAAANRLKVTMMAVSLLIKFGCS